jgi:hypothetical protein
VNIALFFFPRISSIARCFEECLDTRHGCIGNGVFISIWEATTWCKAFLSGISRADSLHCGAIQTSYRADDKREK